MRNKKVLITGGASGIGYHLARIFADHNYTVIVTDVNEVALKRIEKYDIDINTYYCDVGSSYDVECLFSSLKEDDLLPIDILVNNAGIGKHSELIKTDILTLAKMIDVNFWGAIYHFNHCILNMIKNKSGQIVNVCSGQVFFNLPTWGAYTCTKAALASYSEVLHHELKKYGITVTTVYPFMVDTGFYNNVKGNTLGAKLSMKLLPFYSMRPERVAEIIFKAILKKKRREMVSPLNYVGQFISIFPPVSNLVGKISNYLLAK